MKLSDEEIKRCGKLFALMADVGNYMRELEEENKRLRELIGIELVDEENVGVAAKNSPEKQETQ